MRLFALALVLGCLAACNDAAPRREWRASDHTQPQSRGESQGQTPADGPAPDDGQGRARAAAALFRMECASCHGDAGRGDGPMGASVQAPSLVTDAVRALSDADLRAVIANGRGAMPGFGTRYTPDAVAALAEHVRTLAAR